MFKKYVVAVAFAAVLVLGGAFYAGIAIGRSQIPSEYFVEGVSNLALGQPENTDFSLFWDAWRKLEEEFVGRGEIDSKDLVYGAIAGMVGALDDPYTVFFEPREAEIFREDISGSFEGIGAEIGTRNDILTIISPIKDSPAERAGLRAGDKVAEIDGESTSGLNLNEAVGKIRGERGTAVVLTVLREGEAEPQEISIVRDRIAVPVLEFTRTTGNVAHIELFSFSQEASRKFREVASDLNRNRPTGIVLDLRNNPGGFLEVAQELMGWFVDSGEIIAREDFGDGRPEKEYRAIGNGSLSDIPVVVLINKGSASASEIMAGALRDIRGVQLVGEKSFGKGSIQELFNLKEKSSLKITIARWLTPSGQTIAEVGLEPDVVVELTGENLESGEDPQLEKALELLIN